MSDQSLPAPDTSGPLLEVRDVSKAFGGLLALQDVSLAVWPGQIKGLIGPNGAGKTTLFNLVAGMLKPTQGDIVFRGRSIIGLEPFQVARLGIVRTFQNVQVFPGLTVLENVLVGFHTHLRAGLLAAAVPGSATRKEEADVRVRAAELLDRVGLSTWAEVPAERVSYGLQRVVEIARALAVDPTLLLLDEPGAGLNATEKARVGDLIEQIRTGGTTVFLVEHDMDVVMGLADEVAVLDQGTLIAEGSPSAVQENPGVIAAYLGEPEPVHVS